MRKPKEGPANNRLNLRLTDAELHQIMKRKSQNITRTEFVRNAALAKPKAYIVLDEHGIPVNVFKLKMYAEDYAKLRKRHTVVGARYD